MKYSNPIIKGFHPDPSICRVEEDYYLVTSSFEYFPGIPIFHSSDLVNWKQIGNCVTDAEKFSLSMVKDSGGIWAPVIRFEQGVFYVTATLDGYGNFIISAKNPRGPWSAPVWVPVGGIDPSLFFEEGKAYYCTNESLHAGEEEITLEEIDVHTGKLIGEQRTIWNGIGGGYLEAPHIYHVGEWYYLMAAEGGTFFTHMITLARSRSVWGPYESCPINPILTNRHDTGKEVMCTGHGDLLQDHRGNWWIVHLGIRLSRRTMSHLGRETFLTPVIWENGWFFAENNRSARLAEDGPLWITPRMEELSVEDNSSEGANCDHGENMLWQADFNREEWEPEFRFLRTPHMAFYRRENGKLYLRPSTVTLEDEKSPTFVGICQPDFSCEIEAVYSFVPEQIGDEAGLTMILSSQFHYCFGKRKTAEGNVLFVEKTADDFRQTACEIPVQEGELVLHIKADKEKYTFFYHVEGGNLTELCSASTRFLACEIAGKCFTGTLVGLYAVCREETKAAAEVRKFNFFKKL